MDEQKRISSVFGDRYEKIKLLGEGNYGKALLVKSKNDNVIKYYFI